MIDILIKSFYDGRKSSILNLKKLLVVRQQNFMILYQAFLIKLVEELLFLELMKKLGIKW
jgi:hypothetical protein